MQQKLATMLGLTDTTINVVRRIASELRPSILDDLGLMEAIEWQTQQFQARTGIQCNCDCSMPSIPLPESDSPPPYSASFRKPLTNILRHAQATRVSVAMKEENGALVLTVTDNGRGITDSGEAQPKFARAAGNAGTRPPDRRHMWKSLDGRERAPRCTFACP